MTGGLPTASPDATSEFHLLYGEYTEKHGLPKRTLSAYWRMCDTVPAPKRLVAYRLCVTKAAHHLGATLVQPVYNAVITALEEKTASQMCLQHARIETGLRETDRARTALAYGA